MSFPGICMFDFVSAVVGHKGVFEYVHLSCIIMCMVGRVRFVLIEMWDGRWLCVGDAVG